MRISTMAAALAAAAVLLVPLAGIASAQDRDCPDFASQAEAQAALDASTGDPERLDGDGIACEDHFGEPVQTSPVVGDADASATGPNSHDAGRQVTIVPRGAIDAGDGSTSPSWR